MRLRFIEFVDIRHMKVVRLSVLRIGPLYSPGDRFLLEVESFLGIVRPEGLSQLKIPVTLIGNRTRDLPACSAVPQPTALTLTRPLCYK
jgi:hypothetical protein